MCPNLVLRPFSFPGRQFDQSNPRRLSVTSGAYGVDLPSFNCLIVGSDKPVDSGGPQVVCLFTPACSTHLEPFFLSTTELASLEGTGGLGLMTTERIQWGPVVSHSSRQLVPGYPQRLFRRPGMESGTLGICWCAGAQSGRRWRVIYINLSLLTQVLVD